MKMNSGPTNFEDIKQKAKSKFYEESHIRELKEEFGLSEKVVDAAILIFRLFAGLGKGLSSSQKRSYSAVAVWHAVKLIENKELTKEDLAKAVEISPRTLTRRFNDLEDDEDSKVVLEYVKYRIKEWSRKREKRLQNLL